MLFFKREKKDREHLNMTTHWLRIFLCFYQWASLAISLYQANCGLQGIWINISEECDLFLYLSSYMHVSAISQVTRSLAAKAFQSSLSLCKETFFSDTMEDHVVKRFVKRWCLMIYSWLLLLDFFGKWKLYYRLWKTRTYQAGGGG